MFCQPECAFSMVGHVGYSAVLNHRCDQPAPPVVSLSAEPIVALSSVVYMPITAVPAAALADADQGVVPLSKAVASGTSPMLRHCAERTVAIVAPEPVRWTTEYLAPAHAVWVVNPHSSPRKPVHLSDAEEENA